MYFLDATVLINASRLYYAPDIAPTFWDWLANEHEKGTLASIRRVRDEINDGKEGHLTQWSASLPKSFWKEPDEATVESLTQLSTWVEEPDRPYSRAARDQFFAIADYFLVAQAHAGGHHVVTFEQSKPESKKRVMIPDACKGIGVAYREPFSVYRELKLRFHCVGTGRD